MGILLRKSPLRVSHTPQSPSPWIFLHEHVQRSTTSKQPSGKAVAWWSAEKCSRAEKVPTSLTIFISGDIGIYHVAHLPKLVLQVLPRGLEAQIRDEASLPAQHTTHIYPSRHYRGCSHSLSSYPRIPEARGLLYTGCLSTDI